MLGGFSWIGHEDLEIRILRKWVVLSCTPDSAYDFFLPIAVRLWRKRIGYEPIVVLIGSGRDWCCGHAKVVYDEILGKERIEFFQGIKDIPDAAVSQALRQQVSALEFDLYDTILIGDVDLFPVDREFYHRYDPSENPVGIYYAEMYRNEYWPAYGVSMSVRNWREVMGVVPGDFRGSVERVFTAENVRAAGLEHDGKPWDRRFWFFDERFTSFKIKSSRFAKDVATFPSSIGTKVPHRIKLPSQPYIQDYVDFHCARPGWTEDNWPDIRYALAQMIPEDLRWIDRYVDAYRRSLEGGPQVAPDNLEATPLPWDSKVFGVKVGSLKLDGLVPESSRILEANRGKVDVVFAKASGWHEPKGVVALDYTYDMELSEPTPQVDPTVIALSSPRQAHVEIAKKAFSDSRFRRDPRLAEKVEAFYEKWLSGNGVLYVLPEAFTDDAFLFVSTDQDGAGRISLVAVFEKSRGIGIGKILIQRVMQLRRDLTVWRVRVSSRNVRAIRFYEAIGFRVKSVQTAFHVWTNNDR